VLVHTALSHLPTQLEYKQKGEFSDTNFEIGPMFQLNASVFLRVK